MAMEYEKKLGGEVLADTLIDLVKEGLDIVTIENDLRFTFTNRFGQAYPDRFIEAGIAEANSIGIASGMSEAGMIPVVHSLTPFITRRCYDQIVISIQYSGLHVKLIGTDPGIYSELNGGTHLSVEDVAIMRAIPGMLVLCPCDGNEMRLAVEALVNYEGPAYMRLGRLAVETVTDSIPGYKFELGKGATLRDGTDVTIIAVGMNVQMALAAAEKLAAEGISARVIDMHTIKPLDTELVLKAAKETGAIVTTEEANVLGGLGAAVAEYLGETYPIPVVRHGVNDEFGRSGKAPLVLDAYGINADGIAAKAKQAIAMKK